MMNNRYLSYICACCGVVAIGLSVYFGYVYFHLSMVYQQALKRPDIMSIPIYYSIKISWALHWLTVSVVAAICLALFSVLLRRSLR